MSSLIVPNANKEKTLDTGSIHLAQNERDELRHSLAQFVNGLIRYNIDLNYARNELDYFYISEVLRHNGGNIGRAAKTMGMHRNTLSKRIRELNIAVKNASER